MRSCVHRGPHSAPSTQREQAAPPSYGSSRARPIYQTEECTSGNFPRIQPAGQPPIQSAHWFIYMGVKLFVLSRLRYLTEEQGEVERSSKQFKILTSAPPTVISIRSRGEIWNETN